jgi:hypothetical protein
MDYEDAGKRPAKERRRMRSLTLRGGGLSQLKPQRPSDPAAAAAGIGGPVDEENVERLDTKWSHRAEPDKPVPPADEEPVEIPTKILMTEYAIGQGLITRDEYIALRDQYFTQSQATFGLILPLVGIIAAINSGGTFDLECWVSWLLGAFAVVAFFGGLDRLHKYYSELQTLIVSRYVALVFKKREEAAKENKPKPKDGAPAVTLSDLHKAIAELRSMVEILPKAPITIINERRSQS